MPEELRFSLQGTRKTDEGNDFRRAMLFDRIQTQWKSGVSNVVAFSAAGKVFEQLLDEFLKNSTDAEADFLDFSVAVENNIITIQISDDGKKEIPRDKLGRYDWKKALQNKSQKSPENQLGGKNLGLAIAAHFLETQGQGALHLMQNPAKNHGATVILTSSNKNLGDLYIMPENFNYVHRMINDLEGMGTNPEEIDRLRIQHQSHFTGNASCCLRSLASPVKLTVTSEEDETPPSPPPATKSTSRKKLRPPSLFISLPSPSSEPPSSLLLQPPAQ